MIDPRSFGKVAVLMGGWSAEREVSLQSGAAVLAALQRSGVDAVGVDVDRDGLLTLNTGHFDNAWIALHGTGGEDGLAQAVLETQGIAYTGSGVLASALAMDKYRCKALWAGQGIPTPGHCLLHEQTDFAGVASELGLPLFVKPACEGSSIGMSKVETAGELGAAWRLASRYDTSVLAERFIAGPEYTASILAGQVLPLIRIETPRGFYDYQAKYESEKTLYHCPCGLDDEAQQRLERLSLRAFEVLGARGWGRVDFMLDQHDQPWFLELNTIPGMTSHSLVPMAAAQAGIDFDTLVLRILAANDNVAGGAP